MVCDQRYGGGQCSITGAEMMRGLITAAVTRFKTALAASSGASGIGYLPSGVGAIVTTVQNKLRERVSATDDGAEGDGVTPDLINFGKVVTHANTLSTPICIDVRGNRYRLEGTLEINPYRMGLSGCGAVLDFSQDAVTTAMKIRGATAETPFYNCSREFSGFVVKGPAGALLLDITSDAEGTPIPQSSFLTFDHVHLTGVTGASVDTAVRLGNHTWVMNFIAGSSAYATTHFYVPPSTGLTNYGERTYIAGWNCFGGGTAYRSEWRVTDTHMSGSSIDQTDRVAHLIDGGQFFGSHLHIETPTDTLTLFELSGASSAVVIKDSVIRTDVRSLALGNVDASCVNGGLTLENVLLDMPGYSHARLITGSGRVKISNMMYELTTSKPQVIYSDYLNVLSDGGFLAGDYHEWGVGAGVGPVVDTVVKHGNNNSLKFDAPTTAYTSILDLTRQVRQGQEVLIELYYKLTNLVSAVDPADYRAFSIRVDIFDRTGTTSLLNREYYFGSVAGTTVDFTRFFSSLNNTRAPKGSDHIRVRLALQGATGTAWASSVCVNIVD